MFIDKVFLYLLVKYTNEEPVYFHRFTYEFLKYSTVYSYINTAYVKYAVCKIKNGLI
jgi:hypothetical protein